MREIGVLPLHGVVQHYDWGGYDFIPKLLGIANSERKPFAELWMGAHPKAPATADVAGVAMPLDQLIADTRQNPRSNGQCALRRTSALSV